MPSSEYRTSDVGEAAHANARPCRRFFRTLCARDAFGEFDWVGWLSLKLAA
jgi:hypothetical protein